MKKLVLICFVLGFSLSACDQSKHVNDIKSEATNDSISNQVQPNVLKLKSMERPGKLKGLWLDEEQSVFLKKNVGYKFMVSEDNRLFVQMCYVDDESATTNAETTISGVASELRDDKSRYTVIDDSTEYYIINKDGSLSVYDDKGLVVKCKLVIADFS